jgi:hypothetical protein
MSAVAFRMHNRGLDNTMNSVAVTINNLGVKQWSLGKYAEAEDCFYRALRASRDPIATECASFKKSSGHDLREREYLISEDALPFQIGHTAFTETCLPKNPISTLPVYAQPIKTVSPGNDEMVDYAVSSAVIIFNTALTSQLSGFHDSSLGSEAVTSYLLKAKMLYGHAIQLLHSPSLSEAWDYMTDIQQATCDMIFLGSLNNLIQISFMEAGISSHDASFYASQLSCFASSFTASRYQSQELSCLMLSQGEVFLRNLASTAPLFTAPAA